MKTNNFLPQSRKAAKSQISLNNFLKSFAPSRLCAFAFILTAFSFSIIAQNVTEPKPSAPKPIKIPAVKEMTLKNGLKVAVIENKNVPLVTVELLVKSGAASEGMAKAGLANMTADLLTKGTKTRSATDIAEQMEFLGSGIRTNASWNSSTVSFTVTSDKLDQALAIMSDAVLNPAFKQDEIDLLKSQALDGLTYNLTQPGFLTNYVASVYSFDEHPADGTPASINAITRDDIVKFHKKNYEVDNAVLIFTGDITAANAKKLAEKYFGKMYRTPPHGVGSGDGSGSGPSSKSAIIKRILVVDLPNSGQASVSFAKKLDLGRFQLTDKNQLESSSSYFPATVLNSVLGGGYSSRLNQEIRIKRGLSYGAGSGFAFRSYDSNFGTRTQTKNESAAEVAELVITEIKKLSDGTVSKDELDPRKLVLTGSFGRSLETTGGLAGAVADLYSYGLPISELDSYMTSVNSVSDKQIQDFAGANLNGGDLIIVGDYNIFKEDLAKRFPDMKVTVISADELDITKDDLKK